MAPPKHAAPATRAVHGAIKPAELRELGLRREDCLDFSASISPLGPPDAVTAAVAAVDFSAYPDPRSLELCERSPPITAATGRRWRTFLMATPPPRSFTC